MTPGGPTDVAGLVLAAGASTRMGQAKARLQWHDRSFLELACGQIEAAGCAPRLVVVGAIELGDLVPADAIVIRHPRWRAGQLSSLQTGLDTALCHRVLGVLVCTVDRPRIAVATMQALRAAIDHRPEQLWQPRRHGRSGHPIYFPRDVAQRVLTLPPKASPREVLAEASVAARRRFVDVDDPGVHDNIDTPQNLAAITPDPASAR
ncbi:MAG: nucleotidyltransferase family protein [Myxococcales bacterium FL481]|nr:MAG: nucleotidyltransferase family protein [Myxococcales bacterium FL481]